MDCWALKLKGPEEIGLLLKLDSSRVIESAFSRACFGRMGKSRADANSE